MLSALIKGINQLSDKATRKYVWFSVFAALITFVILWSVVAWLLAQTSITQIGWLESVIDVLGGGRNLGTDMVLISRHGQRRDWPIFRSSRRMR